MTSIYVLVSGRPGSVTVRRFLGQAPALRARAALPDGTPVRYLGPAPRPRAACGNALSAAPAVRTFKVSRMGTVIRATP